jgi:hypothetical protein
MCFFRMTVRISKTSCTHKAMDNLIKVKSCTALLRLLLVCFHSYLKLVLGYKLLILDTHHPDILYLREQGCEDLWLFFVKRVGEQSV